MTQPTYSKSFTASIPIGGHLYPVQFETEKIWMKGFLRDTGRHRVCLKHPEHGSIHFFLKHVGYGWELDGIDNVDTLDVDLAAVRQDYPFTLPDELIDWCSQHIDSFND